MTGRLSVVATPIGCLEDITLRALRILRESDLILAEDTRHTRTLCSKHGIDTPLRSFHAHTNDDKVELLVAELVDGAHYALVSDAGTPVVSDPGVYLVSRAANVASTWRPFQAQAPCWLRFVWLGSQCVASRSKVFFLAVAETERAPSSALHNRGSPSSCSNPLIVSTPL